MGSRWEPKWKADTDVVMCGPTGYFLVEWLEHDDPMDHNALAAQIAREHNACAQMAESLLEFLEWIEDGTNQPLEQPVVWKAQTALSAYFGARARPK